MGGFCYCAQFFPPPKIHGQVEVRQVLRHVDGDGLQGREGAYQTWQRRVARRRQQDLCILVRSAGVVADVAGAQET